jgi:hypothetical protein
MSAKSRFLPLIVGASYDSLAGRPAPAAKRQSGALGADRATSPRYWGQGYCVFCERLRNQKGVGWRSCARVCAGILDQVLELLASPRMAEDHIMDRGRFPQADLPAPIG